MNHSLETLQVANLGPRTYPSPLRLSLGDGDEEDGFVPDESRIVAQIDCREGEAFRAKLAFEKSGPRRQLFFEPGKVRAAIVTCGGLCPGLNNVVRSAYFELHHHYGATEVLGIRYGYRGLNPAKGEKPLCLTSEMVDPIHLHGGTILGSSRGPEDPAVVIDFLQKENIQILLCVGGDGTQRGAHAMAQEALRRKANISVVGIPKTIDNDLPYVWRSFGYGTALEIAREVITCAHNEARGTPNGIGMVKLMGRDAGFIAAGATLASQEVNFCLVPEVPFPLEGENGFLPALRDRILARRHAVIVVAEGAGQHLIPAERQQRDASGNLKLHDIGPFLQQKILEYFAAEKITTSVKYIDPSYTIRSVMADAGDALLCDQFARHAVHAAMAGKTDVLIGLWHNTLLHVPLEAVSQVKRRLSPRGELWRAVLEATGQPHWGEGKEA